MSTACQTVTCSLDGILCESTNIQISSA